MTDETFDRDFWEGRWAQALRERPDKVASRPPNAHLVAEIDEVAPGLALDAGCGHGTVAIWLAASGWRVTAVDFSETALEHARRIAEAVGADVAALDTARQVEADRRQRGVLVDVSDPDDLDEFRLQLRELLPRQAPHVGAWLWRAATSGGGALTALGAEDSYELRLSYYP